MKENEREEKSLAPDEDAAAKQKHRQQEDRSRFFQLLAGGYLVYLAWQLISGGLADNEARRRDCRRCVCRCRDLAADSQSAGGSKKV